MEMRTTFHKKLTEIQDDMLVMGSMVSKAILRSIESLKTREMDLARQIIADDQQVNHKRFEIEEKCIELIATQQPMASDLRLIVAVLNMTSEMERIGDYAEGIARITIMIGDEPPLKPLIDIPRMAEQTVDMLRRTLDAFVKSLSYPSDIQNCTDSFRNMIQVDWDAEVTSWLTTYLLTLFCPQS